MTTTAIDKARGEPDEDENGKSVPTEKQQPGYYVLVPFAVAGDIAIAPFELIFLWDIAKSAN